MDREDTRYLASEMKRLFVNGILTNPVAWGLALLFAAYRFGWKRGAKASDLLRKNNIA